MAALSAQGESDSWEEQKGNHKRIFELFRTSDPALVALMPFHWDALPEGEHALRSRGVQQIRPLTTSS